MKWDPVSDGRITDQPPAPPASTTEPAAADPEAVDGLPVSRRRLAIGICVTVVAIAFEAISVATAMPVAARELHGFGIYAWAFSAFLIGMLLATVVAGRLSDRTGPTSPLMIGMVVFAAGLVVAATAPTMAQLVAARAVQGLGSGAMNVATYVVIAQVFPPPARPRMFTYISTAWVVPSFVGPPVAAWLTDTLSWHWVFWAVLPLVGFGALMVWPTLIHLSRVRRAPTSTGDGARPAPLWAAGVAALGAAVLQLAGQHRNVAGVGIAAAGVAALLVSVPPLMPPGFLRLRRGLVALILTRTLLPGAYVGAEAFVPLMLVEQRSLRLVLAGATLTFGSVGWTTGSWLQSRRLAVSRDRLITLGCLSVGLGIALVALVAWLPALWVGVVAVGWVFSGFGMGLCVSSTSLAAMTLSEPAEQGRNASSLQLGDALGTALFLGVSGAVFAALHPEGNDSRTFGTVFLAMLVGTSAAAAVSLRIGRIRNEVAP